MKLRIFGTMAVLFLGAGWVSAQAPVPVNHPSPPPGSNARAPSGGPYNYGINQSRPAAANHAPAPILGTTTVPGGPGSPGSHCASGLCDAVNGYGQGCDSGPTFYASAEYLLWKIRNGAIPQTATAVPIGLIAVDVSDLFTNAANVPGVPGANRVTGFAPVSIVSNTQFGAGRSSNYGEQTGVRLTAGWWADSDMTMGVEVSGFALERGSDTFAAVSALSGNQFTINTGFNRNLFLVQGGAQTLLSSFPVIVVREATSQTFGTNSNRLWGAELNFRSTCLRFGCIDIGGLVGFRYIQFQDELNITNQVRLFRSPGLPVTQGDTFASLSSDLTFRTQDRIRIANHFAGGQIGADADARFGAFFINARLKGGVGTIFRRAEIDSATRLVNNDPVANQLPSRAAGGGLLVSPADVGSRNDTRFSFLAEVNLKIGYQISDNLRGFVGYDGLYMGHMGRAGLSSSINTLNTTVQVANSTNQVQVSAPAFRFREQDVWAQGLSAGFEVQY